MLTQTKTKVAPEQACMDSLKLLGDFWTLHIIDALRIGELRFCELQRSVGNLNPVTLTNRLKKLEKSQLIRRREESIDRCSVTYSLTDIGRKSLPIVSAVNHFSKYMQTG